MKRIYEWHTRDMPVAKCFKRYKTKERERKREAHEKTKHSSRLWIAACGSPDKQQERGGLGTGAGASTFKLITVKVNCPKQCNIPFKGPWEFAGELEGHWG